MAAQSQYPPFVSAQSSADMGNIGAVRKSLKGNSKACVMTTANQKICAKLYPARIEKRGAHKFDPVGNTIYPPPVADFDMEYDDKLPSASLVELSEGRELDRLGIRPISLSTRRWPSAAPRSRGSMRLKSTDSWKHSNRERSMISQSTALQLVLLRPSTNQTRTLQKSDPLEPVRALVDLRNHSLRHSTSRTLRSCSFP